MRILAIRGCNLASLSGPFAVELDGEPLRRAGLFAITGPTGAGKSTILDALCLALFDTMPRLPNGNGVRIGREGDTDAISSTDVRAVLRRGAGSGWAEVDFIGADGAAYRARWELRRANMKARGRLQNQAMSLSSLDGARRFGDTKTSVLSEIVARLGLNFDQFRRSVLLAQGDFATFLKAPARERSTLLELLTGTEIYSRISIAAHQRCAVEQRALDALQAQRGAILVLPDEERAALAAEADHAHACVQADEQAVERSRAAVSWHERAAGITAAEESAMENAQALESQWRDAAPRRQKITALREALPLRGLIAEADRTAAEAQESQAALILAEQTAETTRRLVDLSTLHHTQALQAAQEAIARQQDSEPTLERATTLDGQITSLTAEHTSAESEQTEAIRQTTALAAEHHALEAALAAIQDEATTLGDWLAGQGGLAAVAREWERWAAAITRFGAAQAVFATADATIGAHRTKAERHEAALAALELSHTDKQAALADADARLAALHAEPMPALAALSRQRIDLDDRRARLSGLAQTAASAARTARDAVGAGQERAQCLSRAEAEEAQAVTAKAEIEHRHAALAEAEDTLRRLLLAVREDVRDLRAQLSDGNPCPVCGAEHHPWAETSSPLPRLADEQERRVAALRATAVTLGMSLGAHEAAAREARNRLISLDGRLQDLSAEQDTLARRWTAQAAGFALPAQPWGDDAANGVQTLLTTVSTELDTVATAEQAALAHQARLDEATRSCHNLTTAMATAAATAETVRRQRDAARHAEALAVAERDRAERDRAEQADELAEPFAAIAGWEESLRTAPAAFRDTQAKRVTTYRDAHDQQARKNHEAEALAHRLSTKATEQNGAHQREQAARQRAEGVAHRLKTVQTERAGLFDGRPVTTIKHVLAEARSSAETILEGARAEHQNAITKLSAAQQEVTWRRATVNRATERAMAAATTLTEAANARALSLDEARSRLTHGDAWLASEEEALATLDAARRDAAVLLAERRRLRAEHHASGVPETTPEEARAHAAAMALQLDEARRRHGQLQGQLRIDAENRDRLATMGAQWNAQREVHALWAALDQLIGSANGQKLRNFAQSLSLDLLLEQANRYLEDLARRYRLERAPGADLEIQVVDREMGNELRGVHSLSGGEMFLVSLALALGLSSMAASGGGMAAGSGGIGTLFIDEGFGTLDPNSLDVALSCLEALQASGRQVGVISHVPAMVERIGAQVCVMPQGGGRSGVRVLTTTPSDIPRILTTV